MILDLHTHSVRSDDGRAKVENYCQWIRKKDLPLDGFVLTEHRQFDDVSDYRALEDEYGLLIPGVGEAQALERAGRLLAVIRSRTGAANLTASAGVALVERDMGVSATDLITAADIAVHQAKEQGRDRAVAFSGEDRSRLEWVGHVRQAVNEGGLVLYSQPIIDMASGLACAEELLVRMVDPVSGRPISAGEFVPTAERFGLARNLDHWVVRQALDLITSGRHVIYYRYDDKAVLIARVLHERLRLSPRLLR